MQTPSSMLWMLKELSRESITSPKKKRVSSVRSTVTPVSDVTSNKVFMMVRHCSDDNPPRLQGFDVPIEEECVITYLKGRGYEL